MAILPAVFFILKHSLLNQPHRLKYALMILLGRQQLQRLFFWDLNVHAHTVGIAARLVQQFL